MSSLSLFLERLNHTQRSEEVLEKTSHEITLQPLKAYRPMMFGSSTEELQLFHTGYSSGTVHVPRVFFTECCHNGRPIGFSDIFFRQGFSLISFAWIVIFSSVSLEISLSPCMGSNSALWIWDRALLVFRKIDNIISILSNS